MSKRKLFRYSDFATDQDARRELMAWLLKKYKERQNTPAKRKK